MSVYLGNEGGVLLRRTSEPVAYTLRPDDVNAAAKRFSVEFNGPCPFITGDQLEIARTDGTADLELVPGGDRSVTRFAHVDQAGGIRLYTTFPAAVNGGAASAVALTTPSGNQDITIDVANISYQCVAQMTEWEMTTNRETVDLTTLGKEFRQSYDQGLISGQGTINALWDYTYNQCTDDYDDNSEVANYFSNLVIRVKEGANFKGIFIVFNGGEDASVFYVADCIVTSVGLTFPIGQPITSTIQFVTTGEIALRQGAIPGYILQEDTSLLLLEERDGALELEVDL